jgi:hypothetical protein
MAMFTSKKNKRLELPLSDTVSALKVREDQTCLEDDIMSDDATTVMTDGCGWIGEDLAKEVMRAIPFGVKGGQLQENSKYIDLDKVEISAAIQIRLNCWHGFHKGMLVVSPLPQHRNKVGLRPSMKKIDPSLRWGVDLRRGVNNVAVELESECGSAANAGGQRRS